MVTPTIYPIIVEQIDTDYTQRMSISALIGNVLQTAANDADAKGFGVGVLNENNHSWALSRFAIEANYLPKAFDKLEIETWICDYSRLITTRNFIVRNSSGEIVAGAVSQWCMIDVKERKAVELTSLHANYHDYVLPQYPMPIAKARKILALNPLSKHVHKAAYSDIDFNGHVNALRYIDLMLDMLPLATLEADGAFRVDLQYVHESYLGEDLEVGYEQRENVSMFEIKRDNLGAAVKCMIEWR